jgi:endoplasmic reticulum chaperone BiP
VTAAFDISIGPLAFGVRRGAPKEYCDWRGRWDAAPFLLGSAAAIHLGNTNSCIAAYDFRLGSHEYYQLCMPSWVAVTDNGTILSGEAAMNHATVSPGTAISGFTRLLNQKLTDDVVKSEMKLSPPYKFSEREGRVAIQFNHPSWRGEVIEFSPVDLAVVLVSELKHRAEAHLGRELSAAVIAVSRHLNYNGRHDVVNGGRHDAGFYRGAKAIDRQIAAAVAYHHHTEQGDGKAILVLRVGGRTSDATIFKFIDGEAHYVMAQDDIYLGGK